MKQIIENKTEEDNKKIWSLAIIGSIWSYITIYSGKIIVFVSLMILARLLEKEEFGVAGYALTIMAFLNVVNDFGIRSAIIYFPKSSQSNNQAFWFNIAIGFTLSGLVWASSTYIGDFFGDDRAIAVTQVMSFSLPVLALGNTHDAILQKNMQFNLKAIPDTARVVSKGLVSIVLALLGFGYWSLIWGYIAGTIFWVVFLWWNVAWRPSLRINFEKFKPLFIYSVKILTMSVLARIATNGDYLLVGRYLGATALGVYTLAFRLPELLIQEIPIVASNVLFPAFSKLKSSGEEIGKNAIQAIQYSCLVTIPLGIGLILIAQPLIILVFSEKWVEATPVMILIAAQMTIVSLNFIFGMIYKAIGRPEILSTIVFIRVLVLLPSLWIAASQFKTLVAVGTAHVLVAILAALFEIQVAIKLQGLKLSDILNAFKPSIVGSCGMALAVIMANYFFLDGWAPLPHVLTAISIGVLSYLLTLYLFQKEMVFSIRKQLNVSFSKV